jgi:hypothetical protein
MRQVPLAKEKTYCLTDYKSNRKVTGPNIYHVKTEVSDLRNIDFAIGALEYRLNKLKQGIQELKSPKFNPSPPAWLTIFPIIGLFLIFLLIIALEKKSNE